MHAQQISCQRHAPFPHWVGRKTLGCFSARLPSLLYSASVPFDLLILSKYANQQNRSQWRNETIASALRTGCVLRCVVRLAWGRCLSGFNWTVTVAKKFSLHGKDTNDDLVKNERLLLSRDSEDVRLSGENAIDAHMKNERLSQTRGEDETISLDENDPLIRAQLPLPRDRKGTPPPLNDDPLQNERTTSSRDSATQCCCPSKVEVGGSVGVKMLRRAERSH